MGQITRKHTKVSRMASKFAVGRDSRTSLLKLSPQCLNTQNKNPSFRLKRGG